MRAPVALGRLCRHRNRATYVAIQWHACRWPRRLVLFPWIMDAQPASHSTGLDDDACLFMLTARASSASGDLRFARCAYALVTIRGKSLPVPAILCRVRVYQFLPILGRIGRNDATNVCCLWSMSVHSGTAGKLYLRVCTTSMPQHIVNVLYLFTAVRPQSQQSSEY